MNFTEETLRNTNNERLFLHASHRPWSNDSPSYQSYPMSRLNGSAIASILLLSPSEMRHHRLPMPLKLYSILNNARQDVVSWLPDGRSFQIHHPERLERDILIHYFDCGDQSYLSFARLLSLWNFETGSANIYRHQVRCSLLVLFEY